jgi:hypothetical protein
VAGSTPKTVPGWDTTSMNCLRMYGTPAFHIGTLNSSRSAASNRAKAAFAPARRLLRALGRSAPEDGHLGAGGRRSEVGQRAVPEVPGRDRVVGVGLPVGLEEGVGDLQRL